MSNRTFSVSAGHGDAVRKTVGKAAEKAGTGIDRNAAYSCLPKFGIGIINGGGINESVGTGDIFSGM